MDQCGIRFAEGESIQQVCDEEVTTWRKLDQKDRQRKKDKDGSESDKESIVSSQFLEHLLEFDRLENGHLHQPVKDVSLPNSFISVRNYLTDDIKTSHHNPNQRKTLVANNNCQTDQKETHIDKSVGKLNRSLSGHKHYENKSSLKHSQSNIPDILPKDKMNTMIGDNPGLLSHREISRSHEKEELKRINDRFSSYIQYVRQLGEVSNQVDSSAFLKSTKILEEEINSLKNLYENELDKLRSDVEELIKGNGLLQNQFNKSKQTTGELESRLSVEMSRNSKLNEELNIYHQRLTSLESELNDAKVAANRPMAEIEQLHRNIESLARENNTWKHRYEEGEMGRNEDQDKVQQLMKKLDFNDQVHSQQVRELHERLESSASNILSLEAKIRDIGHVDNNIGELLREVRETSDAELRKYQEDSQEYHNRNISALKHQRDQDKGVIQQLAGDKQNLERLLSDLQTKIRLLESQVSALEQQKESFDGFFNQERSRASDQNKLMEKKLQDLQEVLFAKVQEVNSAIDANVPLKTEIEALKVLLEDEERRLRLPVSTSGSSSYPSATTTNNYSNNYLYSRPLHRSYTPPTTSLAYPSKPYTPPTTSLAYPSKPYTPPKTSYAYPSKPYSPKLMSQSFSPLTSPYQDAPVYTPEVYEPLFSEVNHFLDNDDQSQEVIMPTDKYTYESSPSLSRLQYEPKSTQYFRPVGPIRAKSAPAHSRDVQLVPTSLGQGQDYFDEMFKDLAKDTLETKLRPQSSSLDHGMTSTQHDYSVATSSATGDIKVLEVHQEGKYIRLVNDGVKDNEFGGYMIQQNVGGHPVAVYRFAPRTKFSANSTITVWSAMNESILHQPPTDFIWKEQQKWGTGPECTTILCKPNGQAIAWTTAAHRFTQNNYDEGVEENSENSDSIGEIEESLTELPVDIKTDQVYLRREKQKPHSLSPQKHPHGTSPAVSTHPHGNPSSYLLGTISTKTQIRSHPRPDILNNSPPVRVASAPQRKSPQQATLKGNGILTNKPVEFEGRTSSPPSAFMKPKNRFSTGLTQLQSQHHADFLPPMPRPPLNSAF